MTFDSLVMLSEMSGSISPKRSVNAACRTVEPMDTPAEPEYRASRSSSLSSVCSVPTIEYPTIPSPWYSSGVSRGGRPSATTGGMSLTRNSGSPRSSAVLEGAKRGGVPVGEDQVQLLP